MCRNDVNGNLHGASGGIDTLHPHNDKKLIWA